MKARAFFSLLCFFGAGGLFLGAYYYSPSSHSNATSGISEITAPLLAGSKSDGPLLIDQPEVDLGISKGRVSHRFHYKNQGEKALVLRDIQPSCACIAPAPDRLTLQPGESGSVVLETDLTKKDPGAHRFILKIEYECDGPKIAIATIKVSYQPDIQLIPDRIELTPVEGQSASTTICLVDYRRTPLEIRKFRTSTSLLRVSLKERPTDYSPGWRYVFTLDYAPTDARQAQIERETVYLETSDLERPLLEIPVVVRRIARLRYAPETVRVGEMASAKVVVRDSLGEKVVVDGWEAPDSLGISYSPEGESVKLVTITLSGRKVDSPSRQVTVYIKVKSPCATRLPVTVLLPGAE